MSGVMFWSGPDKSEAIMAADTSAQAAAAGPCRGCPDAMDDRRPGGRPEPHFQGRVHADREDDHPQIRAVAQRRAGAQVPPRATGGKRREQAAGEGPERDRQADDARDLDSHGRRLSSGCGKLVVRAVCPGDGFVVGGVMGEAAVEDADEAVAEGSEGGVVGVTGGSVGVVEGPGAG